MAGAHTAGILSGTFPTLLIFIGSDAKHRENFTALSSVAA